MQPQLSILVPAVMKGLFQLERQTVKNRADKRLFREIITQGCYYLSGDNKTEPLLPCPGCKLKKIRSVLASAK
jgi:hypothetical protein